MKSFIKSPVWQLVFGSVGFVFLFALVEKYAAGVIIWKILVGIPCFLFQFWCFDRMFKQASKEAWIKDHNRKLVDQMLANKANININDLVKGAKAL